MSELAGKLTLNFEKMNESDVREIIVRPLLHRLGYAHGTEANIRTEVTLKYKKAFLGHKNPKKDPILIGRADYICEVISYGRFVVEVKSPSEVLDLETAQQAHTYAAHPEIGAAFILLTNGRVFKLYRVSQLESPIIEFQHADLEFNILKLFNIIGPDSIKKLSNLVKADPGKPLGRGLASRLDIVRGLITYEEHKSDSPLFPNEAIEGLRLAVMSGRVERLADGRIHAHVEVAKAAPMFSMPNSSLGASDSYDFFSADEYVSCDPLQPTIFQNILETRTEPGGETYMPGIGKVALPLGFAIKAYTESVGYVAQDRFIGTMRLDYEVDVFGIDPMLRPVIEAQIGRIPDRSEFSGTGSFELQLSSLDTAGKSEF